MKTIRPLPTKKICRDCKIKKNIVEFGKSKSNDSPRGFYYRSYCWDCGRKRCRIYSTQNRKRRNERLRLWRKSNPEAAKMKDMRAGYKRKYGLTLEQVHTLKQYRDGMCWICLERPKKLFIDHDHKTGKVRGCLCPSCNSFLGRVEANENILPNIKTYLFDQPHADVLLELANKEK